MRQINARDAGKPLAVHTALFLGFQCCPYVEHVSAERPSTYNHYACLAFLVS